MKKNSLTDYLSKIEDEDSQIYYKVTNDNHTLIMVKKKRLNYNQCRFKAEQIANENNLTLVGSYIQGKRHLLDDANAVFYAGSKILQ